MNKPIKVVFADDSDIHHFLLDHLIAKFVALELLTKARDGDELLDQLRDNLMQPDVAILDLHMPQMDGISLAKALLAQFPNILIYGFTSSSDEKEKNAMLDSGFIKVYQKNQLKDLLLALSEL